VNKRIIVTGGRTHFGYRSCHALGCILCLISMKIVRASDKVKNKEDGLQIIPSRRFLIRKGCPGSLLSIFEF